eukprot:m.600815 g.600815  ORF g.600815 m.600815 type:complete len:59 (-) comp22434_c0_seq22:1583-1759(-)
MSTCNIYNPCIMLADKRCAHRRLLGRYSAILSSSAVEISVQWVYASEERSTAPGSLCC